MDAEEREGAQKEWLLWEGGKRCVCAPWLSSDRNAERRECQGGGGEARRLGQSQGQKWSIPVFCVMLQRAQHDSCSYTLPLLMWRSLKLSRAC